MDSCSAIAWGTAKLHSTINKQIPTRSVPVNLGVVFLNAATDCLKVRRFEER